MSDDRLIRALSVLHRQVQHQSLDQHALIPSADSLLCERPLAETALLPVKHGPELAAGAPQLVLQDNTGVTDSAVCTGGSDPAGVCSGEVLQNSQSGAVDVGAPAMPVDALVPSPPPALPLAPLLARSADESHAVMANLADAPDAESTAQAATAAATAMPAPGAVGPAPNLGRLRAADDDRGPDDADARARAATAVAPSAEAAASTEAGARKVECEGKAAFEGGHQSLAQLEEQNRILHELGIHSYCCVSDCQRLRTQTVSRLSFL